MNATQNLLERWWTVRSPETVKAAAERLGVRPTAIANYRAGVSQATPAVIAKMADDLGENAGHWLAQVEAERAHNERDRKAWANVARRLGAAAASVAGVVALYYLDGQGASLATLTALPVMHYAKFYAIAAGVALTVVLLRRGRSTAPVLA